MENKTVAEIAVINLTIETDGVKRCYIKNMSYDLELMRIELLNMFDLLAYEKE